MKAGGPRTVEAGGKGELDPVHAIWGTGPTDVYAAAWDDPGRGLLHSKGDGVWTHEELRDRRLRGVWGSGTHDVYACGNMGVYHRKGLAMWTHEASGSHGATFAIWGSGSKDVYEVGADGEVMRSRGDGAWRKSNVSSADGGAHNVILLAIWGSGPGDVYAGGQGADGVVYHSDGSDTWSTQRVPAKGGISSIFGFGPKDVYAVSHFLYHSAGDGQWETVDIPQLDGNAAAVTGDSHGTLYVGGRDGDLYVRTNGTWTNTRDKGAGTYQALWSSGDDLWIGSETFLEWTDPDPLTDGGP